MSEKLISNSDFLKFVIDKGYSTKDYWSREGWDWASRSHTKFPKFWVNRSEGLPLEQSHFVLRLTLSSTENLPWDWPVEVNCFEASAYCRWETARTGKAVRLPTEDEYYSMLDYIAFD